MSTVQELSNLKRRAQLFVDEVDEILRQAKAESNNVRLTKAEANTVMGYKDPSYIYRFKGKMKEDLEAIVDDNGFLRYNDLWDWAEKHKPNRLKYMKNNIKEFK